MLATLPKQLAGASIIALSAPFRSSGGEAGLPQRVLILKWGENLVRPGGEKIILVDDVVAESLTANQQLVGVEKVPMDYEHQSQPGHKNYKEDPRHSPGSGTIEVVPGEGVYLCGITYTPNGQEHAASYQDVSPVVHYDKDGRPLWISSVALCQAGAVEGLEFKHSSHVLHKNGTQSLSTQTTETMDQNKDETTYRELLVKLLGLKPAGDNAEVTQEEIIAAVDKKIDAMPDDKPEAAGNEALSLRIERMEKAELKRERQAIIDRAGREGKVIPLSAEEIEKTDVAILSAMVDKLPAGEVPTGSTQKKEKPSEGTVSLTVDQKAAAKKLNLTEEEYAKGMLPAG